MTCIENIIYNGNYILYSQQNACEYTFYHEVNRFPYLLYKILNYTVARSRSIASQCLNCTVQIF